MIRDIVVIGAGASGLMLASLLKDRDVLLIDSNFNIGQKVLISGGGKCNITNGKVKPSNYFGNQRFIRNVIKRFDQDRVLSWLGEEGLTPIVRENHQYFCKNSARELLDIFSRESKKSDFMFNQTVKRVEQVESGFEIFTDKGTIKAKRVVVASGGLSFTKIGASSIGFDIAKSLGHTVTNLTPALVGFTVQPEQAFFKSLSGSSIESVTLCVNSKEFHGALLFTHKGISGPVVLNGSLYWEKGKITINFIPTVNLDSLKSSKKNISRILGLSQRMAKTFLEQLEIEDKTASKLTTDEWKKIEGLKSYSFAPAGTFGFSKAEVTKGGVVTDEIDASTMMSRRVENLYFIGEVLDVTGELGGYNFQWAFSSAYVCAKALEC